MRKTVYKLFWAWEYDKEEAWLNSMSERGFALVAIGLCRYTFEECAPKEYTIRLELLENIPTSAQSESYIRFLEETGAEYIGSIMRWAYFRKRTECGEFDLFSDFDSRVKHLNRLMTLLGVLTALEMIAGISNICVFFTEKESISLGVGIPVLCLGLLIGYGYIRVAMQRAKLKKERQLFD